MRSQAVQVGFSTIPGSAALQAALLAACKRRCVAPLANGATLRGSAPACPLGGCCRIPKPKCRHRHRPGNVHVNHMLPHETPLACTSGREATLFAAAPAHPALKAFWLTTANAVSTVVALKPRPCSSEPPKQPRGARTLHHRAKQHS